MGKNIDRHFREIMQERAQKAQLQAELSKANQPKYFKWLWSEKKVDVLLSATGIISCTFATLTLVGSPNIFSLLAVIAICGFTTGVSIYPYTIYKELIRQNYWAPDKNKNKK